MAPFGCHWLDLARLQSFLMVTKFLTNFLQHGTLSPVCQQAHLARNSKIHGHPVKKQRRDDYFKTCHNTLSF